MPPISALHSAQGSKKALQEVKSMSHQVVELLRDGEPREGAFQKTNHGSGVSLKASDLVGVDDGRPVSVTFQTVPQRPSQLVCCEMRPRDLFVQGSAYYGSVVTDHVEVAAARNAAVVGYLPDAHSVAQYPEKLQGEVSPSFPSSSSFFTPGSKHHGHLKCAAYVSMCRSSRRM